MSEGDIQDKLKKLESNYEKLETVGRDLQEIGSVIVRSAVYGDIEVDHVAPGGTVTTVGLAKGVAVYTPNTTRKFSFNLMGGGAVDFHSGRLVVTFSAPSDVRPEKYAEAIIDLH